MAPLRQAIYRLLRGGVSQNLSILAQGKFMAGGVRIVQMSDERNRLTSLVQHLVK